MAPSSFILITLFSLATVAGIADTRMAPGQFNNWQDKVVVEGMEHLMHGESTSHSNKGSDCHTRNNNQNEKAFVRDFEPMPNLLAHLADGKCQREIAFLEDFEPRPSATAYPDMEDVAMGNKEFLKDFEPRPSATACLDMKDAVLGNKEFLKDV